MIEFYVHPLATTATELRGEFTAQRINKQTHNVENI